MPMPQYNGPPTDTTVPDLSATVSVAGPAAVHAIADGAVARPAGPDAGQPTSSRSYRHGERPDPRLRGPSERHSRIFPHAGWFVDPRQVVAAGWHHRHGPLYSGGD